jgi:3',5'-cyclic-AMP phosphodiesterase
MPIHLKPITRRNFLKRSIVAGAGCVLGPSLIGAGRKSDPHTWAMLADTHISGNPEQLGRGINMTDHLKQVCREILALETAPAGVILHGDCAFSIGTPGDYEQLLKLLQPLRNDKLPIHIALGNHDHRARFHAAVGHTETSPVLEKYLSIVQSERANFFILDSLDYDLSPPGALGREQVRWLARSLDAHDGKPAVIVLHHGAGRLADFEELAAVMDERKHVKALFHGHSHRWRLEETPGGVHLITLLPVSYPSRSEINTGATGWVRATFAPDGVQLNVRCINHGHPLHHSVHQLKWRAS